MSVPLSVCPAVHLCVYTSVRSFAPFLCPSEKKDTLETLLSFKIDDWFLQRLPLGLSVMVWKYVDFFKEKKCILFGWNWDKSGNLIIMDLIFSFDISFGKLF